MPELPEVETVVRGLREALPGRRIVSVHFGKTDFIPTAAEISTALPGAHIARVERVGKFIDLWLEPNGSGAPGHLFIHLGMTGRLLVQPREAPPAKHTHAFFELDDGRELRYTDARRFGRIALVGESEVEEFRRKLGAEPLEISKEQFSRLLSGRRAMIKALLLDQRVLRGLGNIYADEALWRARIHPKRHAARLRREEAARLWQALRGVLQEAIRLRGSSISDFVDAAGEPGEFQLRHRAYGREGKACYRCGTKIRRIIVADRSSHFCPCCQRVPGKRR
jgi:formamidopyrimidine-DNA glycosylase